MNTQYIAIAAGGLSLVAIFLGIWLIVKVRQIDRLRKELSLDESERKIDDVIVEHHDGIKKLNGQLDELGTYVSGLANANKKNYQKIGFVRFNPFGDTGGSISFVLALLDADNNGIVISSLHGREGNRVYAKEITSGGSKSQLTEEEQEAIKQAQ